MYVFIVSSCCRLRQVQSLLCEGGTASPDGILCSLGMSTLLFLTFISSCEPHTCDGQMLNKTIYVVIPTQLRNINVVRVFQGLTADITRAARSWPNTCSMDCMEEISWIWNMPCLRSFLKKCWTVSFESYYYCACFSFYFLWHITCLLFRCDLADQGGVCSSVLQPNELQLPSALRVPLEEPASLLHDRGRG